MITPRPLKEETPCPVEGIVFPPQGPPTSVRRMGQASLVVYETKPNIQASSGGPNSNTCLALTLTLGPSATLESIYEAVGQGLSSSSGKSNGGGGGMSLGQDTGIDRQRKVMSVSFVWPHGHCVCVFHHHHNHAAT